MQLGKGAQRTYGSACPGCGAPVQFVSAASTHAVCGYCHSTLVRDGDALQRIGRMAEVFDDFSPLQIGATGQREGKPFRVAGRLQYRYEGGTWTEWFCALDNESHAWLSEDNGSFVWATPMATPESLPKETDWTVGRGVQIKGRPHVVSSVTKAQLAAAQGELSRLPGMDRFFTVVDVRSTSGADPAVVTLDYSTQPPSVSRGVSVSLNELALSGLRDNAAEGKADKVLKGRQFNCPSCGATMEAQLEQTKSMSCPSCSSLIDLSAGIGGELRHAIQDEPVKPFLPLGKQGRFEGRMWQIVGFQHRMGQEPSDPDEHFGWEEYLLYNAQAGFMFLVDSTEGWSLVKPITQAPKGEAGAASVEYAGKKYKLRYRYKAETTYACGEFYWKVFRGQRTDNCDYSDGSKELLNSERTESELLWSKGRTLTSDEVARAFEMVDKKQLLERSDVKPLSMVGLIAGAGWLKFWETVIVIVIIVMVLVAIFAPRRDCDPLYENCSSSSSSGSSGRWSGGSYGSSSGGGHK